MRPLNSLSVRFDGQNLKVIDQQKLPHEEVWLEGSEPQKMFEYIQTLQVRGAPMIGVAAALSLSCFAFRGASKDEFLRAAIHLCEARPTAVNLRHATDQMIDAANASYTAQNIFSVAEDIFRKDEALCEAIANNGAELIADGDVIMTHCNTGALATAGIGTAIGAIRRAYEQKKSIHVFVGETRPLLQGGRLTAWELGKLGIPYTLVTDSMAGLLMAQGKISKVMVGSDRIARNGDFANKVGTYTLAVLAHHHRVSFYVAAPWTTVDLKCESGRDIPIEERHAGEMRGIKIATGSLDWAPKDSRVFNPSFDVTPSALVTGWILDKGVYSQQQVNDGILERI